MRYFLTILTSVFLALSAFGQTLTPVYYPKYMQGSGGSGTDRVPYVCRFTVSGLNANTTYRYVNHFATNPADTWLSGASIFIRPDGEFLRVEYPDLYDLSVCGELTTDASGSYTGWFISEPDFGTPFTPGQTAYFRLLLNDGNGGSSWDTFISSEETVTMINFNGDVAGGTALRSTPAAEGIAKNFVLLYDNPEGSGRPISGSFIENDGTDNSANTFFADFYANHVNGTDKTWGTIIPNNLAAGIKRIAQYSLTDGTEVGFKTSVDGSWAKDGGGKVSTLNTTGGLTDVIVLDGSFITLGQPVAQPQSITFGALAAKTYGEQDYTLTATASSGLAVTYTSSNPNVATIVNGQVHIVGAGTTEITASQAGNNDYQAAAPVTQSLTVNPVALTVTAQDETILQNEAIPAFTVNYSGFVNGDDVADLTTPATATTPATSSQPGTYPIIPTGAVSNNYTFSYMNGTLTITAVQQPQTITFTAPADKTYGNPDFNINASVSSGLPLTYSSSNPQVATVSGTGLIHIVGAGNTTITVSQEGNAAFLAATPVSRTLTVNRAPLTITAGNKTRLFGQPNPELTIVYSGFVNGDDAADLTTPAIVTTAATAASQPGDYPITLSGATAANYAISYVNGVLTVNPLPAQTITFNTLANKRYGDTDFSPGATASSGLAVAYTSSNPQVATIINGNIHIISAGATEITASQPGDAFNAPASPVTRTLNLQKALLEIHADNLEKKQGAPNPVLTASYTGLVNGDTEASLADRPVLSTTATSRSLPGAYTIQIRGAASPNYQIAQLPGILTVLPGGGSSESSLNVHLSSATQLRVNYHATSAGSVLFQLFDINGNRVMEKQLTAAVATNTWFFEIGNLRPGIYLVRLSGGAVLLKTKVFKS